MLRSKRKKEAWMTISMVKGKGVITKTVEEQQKLGFFSGQKRLSDNAVIICESAGVCFGKEDG